MKKKLAIGALSLMLACSAGLGCGTVAVRAAERSSQDTESEAINETATPQAWESIAGECTSEAQEDGTTKLSGFNAYGARQAFSQKMSLENLTVRFKTDSTLINKGDAIGFLLGNEKDAFWNSEGSTAIVFTVWKSLYNGQTRMQAGPSHDYNQAALVYTSETFEKAGFSVAASMVMNDVDAYDLTFNFSKTESGNWKIAITDNIGGVVWSNNANYIGGTTVVYAKAETFEGVLDGDGKIYVSAFGLPSGSNPAPGAYFRVESSSLFALAQTAAEDYKTAAGAITDEESFNEACNLRDKALAAIAPLGTSDAAICNAVVAEGDELTAQSSAAQVFVKAAVQEAYTGAQEAVEAIADEDTLNQDAINSAVTALNSAAARQASYAARLSQENITFFNDIAAACRYAIDKAKAILWTKGFESQIAAIETFEISVIMEKINAAKAVYEAFEGSTAQESLNALNADDKSAVENRIAAAKSDLDDLETKYVALSEITVDVSGKADGEWIAVAGTPSSTMADKDTVEISNLASYGVRSYYKNKVKLDGLSITLGNGSSYASGDVIGFLLGSVSDAWWTTANTTAIAFSLWKDLYSGQSRLQVGESHDYNQPSLAYTSATFETAGFGIASSMVLNSMADYSITISFEQLASGDWKLTITDNYRNAMWSSNANYKDFTCSVYVKAQTFESYLDEDGKIWLLAWGFPSTGNGNPPVSVKMSVYDPSDSYETVELQAAEDKLNDYISSILAAKDADTLNQAMKTREEFIDLIDGLRANDKTYYSAALEAYDTLFTTSETVQALIKEQVLSLIREQGDTVLLLQTEANVTSDALKAGRAALKRAEEIFSEYEARLTEANCAEFNGLLESYAYTVDKAEVVLWVADFERNVAALENKDITELPASIRELKDHRAAFVNTAAYEKLQMLTDEDNAAYTARIAAATETLEAAEKDNDGSVKEYFVNLFVDAVSEDLTIKANIVSAIDMLDYVNQNVTIVETDEVYELYVSTLQELRDASEEWVLSEIEAVKQLLKQDYTTLTAFAPVKTRYKSIDMDLVFEENGNKESIQSKYDDLTALIEQEKLYWFTASGVSMLEQNGTGIYTEMTPQFPNRLNYNKKLDATKGIDVVVELTEAAFYNDNKIANNLCFNFLLDPGAYKSMSPGISIIIWLYPTESNVQIFNFSDKVLGQFSISTPIEGGNFNIRVYYGEYYDFLEDKTTTCWQITVNGQTYTLTDEVLTSEGYEIGTDMYFSFGSFADNMEKPNCLTLVSVNSETFEFVAKTQPEDPDNPVVPDQPVTPDNPETPDEPEDKKDGVPVGVWIGLGVGVPVVAAGVAAAVILQRKKKSKNSEKHE